MDILDNIHKIFVAAVVILAILYGIALHYSVDYKEITTKEKWIKYQNGGANYLVSDINDNVYSLADSWWFLIFDASDRYSRIEMNTTYKIKTIGWRIRILSQYPNIIEFGKMEQGVTDMKNNTKASWVQDVHQDSASSVVMALTERNSQYIQRTGSRYIVGESKGKLHGEVGIYFEDPTSTANN